MHRSIAVLFRRDASRDRRRGELQFAGYRLLWPDGREVDVGLDAFCRYGQKLLGLDRHLAGLSERLMEILCFPVPDPERPMNRLRGHRVRRFLLDRDGPRGRLHFPDGTPTQVEFVLGRDEPRVVAWIGLTDAPDPSRLCLDLAARPAECASIVAPAPFLPSMPLASALSSSPPSSTTTTPPGMPFGPMAEEGSHT